MKRWSLGFLLILIPVLSHATTYRVPADYTTIQGALDVSVAGDTVLVAPGTYSDYTVEEGVASVGRLPGGVTLRSVGGPTATIIDIALLPGWLRVGLACLPATDEFAEIEGFLFTGMPSNGAGVLPHVGARVRIRECVFDPGIPPDPEVDRWGVRFSTGAELEITNCDFRRCSSRFGAGGIHGSGDRLQVDSCTFTEMGDESIRSNGIVRVSDCVFQGLAPEGAVLSSDGDSLLVERCRFQDVAGSRVLSTRASNTTIRENLFVNMDLGAFVISNLAFGTNVSGNTFAFVGNESQWAPVIMYSPLRPASFEYNVVTHSHGGSALDVYVDSRFNVFWGNEGGVGAVGDEDFVVDPEFCELDSLNFHVRESSPCLPENNLAECTELIGAFGADCAGSGLSIMALDSSPRGRILKADGLAEAAPSLHAWAPGTFHIAACDSIQAGTPGTRYLFESWSDGGAIAHTIMAPADYAVITANFDLQYGVTAVADSGGHVEGVTWGAPGTPVTITGVPDSGYVFHNWTGEGDGSYTGLDNPVTVTLNEPLTQTARFHPTHHLLTMVAGEGGTVAPATGLQERGSDVVITATPLPGFVFESWSGTGLYAYNGTDNPAVTSIYSPITQTATFVDAFPTLTMVAGPGGTVTPPTGPQSIDSTVTILATPDEGHAFVEWTGEGNGSYMGTNNPAVVTMHEPLTQTASFTNGLYALEMMAGEGGAVTPESGEFLSFAAVEITATPSPEHVFRGWKGDGPGSYTGPDEVATVTMNGPIAQLAEFDRRGYELTLSLSDTDPHVHEGEPTGSVYLWLDCGTADGIWGLEADVTGTLTPWTFIPATGVLNGGTARHLWLGMWNCVMGPALLGEFKVLPPGDGSMCLGTTAPNPEMYVVGCRAQPARFPWPQDVKITGVRTDGGVPCAMGRGCDEPLLPGMVVSAPQPPPAPVITYEDAFEGSFPNPFATTTSIRFSLSRPERVRLSIYDVAGRRIRLLLDEERPAGAYDLTWSGQDADGRSVPAGIYFVQLDAGPLHETAKLVRLGAR